MDDVAVRDVECPTCARIRRAQARCEGIRLGVAQRRLLLDAPVLLSPFTEDGKRIPAEKLAARRNHLSRLSKRDLIRILPRGRIQVGDRSIRPRTLTLTPLSAVLVRLHRDLFAAEAAYVTITENMARDSADAAVAACTTHLR